jgi:hypothetical protein
MKNSIILFFALCLAVAGQAQHETLFGNARVVGGFGGPIFEWGLGNNLTSSVGGGGGLVIENFFLGGYGMGSIDLDALIDDDRIDQIDLGHGGFWLGYTLAPHKLIHLYASGRIGWGAVGIDTRPGSSFPRNSDRVFVLTPEIGLELNVAQWFRVAGTVGYRYVDGVNEGLGLYKSDAFNGYLANLTLRFGWFGWHRK